MLRRFAIALLVLLAGSGLHAQTDPLVEALRSYQAKDLPAARQHIDQALAQPENAENAEAWLLRGFIYKDIFKDAPSGPEADILREEAMTSLQSCIVNDAEGVYKENAVQAQDFLLRSYFNDAARALAELQDERAIQLFSRYKAMALQIDPDASLKTREIEFNSALGTLYTKKFNKERTNLELYEKAIAAYSAALALDPENYGSNYNLATLFYNRGVYNIQRITADDDIPSMQRLQEVSREFFQQALPYMLKAHNMNPTRRETLLGLEGIYYSLQDQSSADRFRQLFEELLPQEEP